MNLNQLSKPKSQKNNLVWLGITLAFIGFLDASYLAINHFIGGIPPCLATAGCEAVLTSRYAQILGIPTALFGALFYLAIIFSFRIFQLYSSKKLLKLLLCLSTFGALASAFLLYVQAVLIGAYCGYCLISAGITLALLVISVCIVRLEESIRRL